MNQQNITLHLTQSKIDLLRKILILDPELEQILSLPIAKGNKYIVNLSPDLLELLCGEVASEANHTSDKKLQPKYDQLWEYLDDCLNDYYEE